MAKITLYVPDDLRRRLDSEEADEINWSAVFRVAALEALKRQAAGDGADR